jgi:predicted nucleic acid-binding protein
MIVLDASVVVELLTRGFTAYDAAYIALAEINGATLYTTDGKLGKGHRARVRVFRAD